MKFTPEQKKDILTKVAEMIETEGAAVTFSKDMEPVPGQPGDTSEEVRPSGSNAILISVGAEIPQVLWPRDIVKLDEEEEGG